jgi:hypothetical protein
VKQSFKRGVPKQSLGTREGHQFDHGASIAAANEVYGA